MPRKKRVELLAGNRYQVDAKLENGGTWSFTAGFVGVELVGSDDVRLMFDNDVRIDAIAVSWRVREVFEDGAPKP